MADLIRTAARLMILIPQKVNTLNCSLIISEAVHLFMNDLELQNLQDKVVAMTFSEFGRRIKSNESYGTDHGEAAPMFFFGNQVNPIVFGTNPLIDRQVSSKDNLPMEYDFRSVYGSVLEDWFGTPRPVIESVLSFQYEYIPILNRQAVVTNLLEPTVVKNLGQNYPNPFSVYTEIPFRSRGGHVNLKLYDQNGQLVSELINRDFSRGDHIFRLERSNLRTGVYIYELNHLGISYRKTLLAK